MDNAHIEAAIFQGLVFTESAHVRPKNEIYILDPHKKKNFFDLIKKKCWSPTEQKKVGPPKQFLFLDPIQEFILSTANKEVEKIYFFRSVQLFLMDP